MYFSENLVIISNNNDRNRARSVENMAAKNNVQVIIDGKVYTLSGYEDEDYLNKVAMYINNKLTELKATESFKRLNKEFQNTLVFLNIADDYYKVKKQADLLEIETEDKNKEIYELKHEMIALQMKLEEAEQQVEELKKQVNTQEKDIIKLETEISTSASLGIKKTETQEELKVSSSRNENKDMEIREVSVKEIKAEEKDTKDTDKRKKK